MKKTIATILLLLVVTCIVRPPLASAKAKKAELKIVVDITCSDGKTYRHEFYTDATDAIDENADALAKLVCGGQVPPGPAKPGTVVNIDIVSME